MKFIQTNYFNYDTCNNLFDGVITDIPYKNAIKNKLNEQNFDLLAFLLKTDKDTKNNAFLITFVNFQCLSDLKFLSDKTNWKFHTYQIWNKEPIRNWISWSFPLRTVEFIGYFKKGNYKYSFKDGTIKEKYNRNTFGGSLKNTTKNNNSVSYGMYSEIITFKNLRYKKHPTEKPIEFSEMFSNIVGKDKYILDCCCGSGNLLNNFSNSIGIDIYNYNQDKDK